MCAQEALIIQEGVRKPLFMVSAAQSTWKFCCPKASCGMAGRRAGRQGCCLNPGKISCKAGVALNSAHLLASRDSCWSVAFGLFSNSSCKEHRAGPARDSGVAAIEARVPDLAAFHPLEDKYHCQGPFSSPHLTLGNTWLISRGPLLVIGDNLNQLYCSTK